MIISLSFFFVHSIVFDKEEKRIETKIDRCISQSQNDDDDDDSDDNINGINVNKINSKSFNEDMRRGREEREDT